jgi:cytidyltransferase-like protein
VFDLLHIGHIRHLAKAREMGDVLIVTITPDRFVDKGPGRPAFGEQLRAEALAALADVNYVAINQWRTAEETIRTLRPALYVKGAEYRNAADDVTGGIARERAAAISVGAELVFTDDLVFSSSRLLKDHAESLPREAREFLAGFQRQYSFGDVVNWIQAAEALSVLVVGETIIDEYQYCEAIGKSTKQPALVARQETSETFAGGVLAVANHLCSFCREVTVLSQLGTEPSRAELIEEQLDARVRRLFLQRPDSPTILKRRFVDSYHFTNLFELYELNNHPLSAEENEALLTVLRQELPRYDLVVVVDFGHAMLTPQAVQLLCEHSRFLTLNVQANAGNLGYHRISKYARADYLCVAEHEMRLETGDPSGVLEPMLRQVADRMGCRLAVTTRGKLGALCHLPPETCLEVPSFASKVVDRLGAGDTFLAATAPLAVAGAPLEIIGLIGNLAGAEAVATVGHRRYLQRTRLLQHVKSMLS